MTTIRVETVLNAPPEQVWADVRNIDSHVDWMHDAVNITFASDQTEGVGTTFECLTKVGPLRLTDQMVITSWVDNAEMGVRHVGLVTGEGVFRLTAEGEGRTRFAWEEKLFFPWWLGGPVGGLVGGQILKLIWKRNLQILQKRFH